MITAISTLDRLTDADHKDYDYFFRLCPLNYVYVEDMLKDVYKRQSFTTAKRSLRARPSRS